MYPVSTHVRAEWTFRSGKTPGNEPTALPLSVIRFSPVLTLSSTAKAGKRFEVPVSIEGAAAGQQPEKLAFEVSYDEGATWQPTKTVSGTHLTLTHPAKAGSVSLRAELTDRKGNTLVQTIERAYLTTKSKGAQFAWTRSPESARGATNAKDPAAKCSVWVADKNSVDLEPGV